MNETTFIYALVDPRDARIRYIGKADDPERRAVSHVKRVKKTLRSNQGMGKWLLDLRTRGSVPGVMVLEEVPKDRWEVAEQQWIKDLREARFDLLNLHPGGGGTKASVKITLSPEHRRKIGETNRVVLKGRMLSPEHRANISKAQKGKKMPRESVEKTAAANRGKKRTPEQRAKISVAHLGQVPSNKGKKASVEHKAALVLAWK